MRKHESGALLKRINESSDTKVTLTRETLKKVKYVRTSVLKHGENVGFAADPDVS